VRDQAERELKKRQELAEKEAEDRKLLDAEFMREQEWQRHVKESERLRRRKKADEEAQARERGEMVRHRENLTHRP